MQDQPGFPTAHTSLGERAHKLWIARVVPLCCGAITSQSAGVQVGIACSQVPAAPHVKPSRQSAEVSQP
jgi:hypothetical protein